MMRVSDTASGPWTSPFPIYSENLSNITTLYSPYLHDEYFGDNQIALSIFIQYEKPKIWFLRGLYEII